MPAVEAINDRNDDEHGPRKGRRQARVNVRLPEETKATIKQAAALTGVTITEFIVSAAADAAYRRLFENAVVSLRLNPEDSLRLVAALADPAPPNEALQRLMAADH